MIRVRPRKVRFNHMDLREAFNVPGVASSPLATVCCANTIGEGSKGSPVANLKAYVDSPRTVNNKDNKLE